MVCKEELCFWFQKLSPSKRIEYMCTLIHMCLPLELRFVGTVLEHYGKKDYHYLRNDEVTANKQSDILKYKNITKPDVLRSKVSVTLALMRSSSTACAQIIYEIIESKLTTVFSFAPGADRGEAEEVLTVLILAANHPAFMFEQKLRLYEHLTSLTTQRGKVEEDEVPLDLYPDNHLPHYPAEEAPVPVHHAALCNRHSPVTQPRKVFVQQIEVRGPQKVPEKKPGPEYVIVATWSNGEATEVGKRFKEIQEFSRQMIDMFPEEKPPNGRLPSLPTGSSLQHSSREEHIAEQIGILSNYFSRILASVPSHILESEHVCQFFRGSVIRPPETLSVVTPSFSYSTQDDAAGRSHRYYHPPMYVVPPRFPTSHACQTLLMTTPPMSAAAMHQHQHQHPHQQQHQQPPSLQQPPPPQPQPQPQQLQQHQQQQQQPSPVSPSSRSELSSTATSPTCSRSASPSTEPGSGSVALSVASVTQLLKVLGLEKFSTALGGFDIQQLSSLSLEELSKHGLPRDAQHILRSKLDQINRDDKQAGLPNGLVDSGLGYQPFSLTPSPSTSLWMPSTYSAHPGHYSRAPPQPPASPRSGVSVIDSSVSDLASIGGASPPVSPGPVKLSPGMVSGKGGGATTTGVAASEDSSEGSEDLSREKSEGLIPPEGAKSMSHHQHQSMGKTAQVKVPSGSVVAGGGGGEAGGSSSPRPSSANAHMMPPDDSSATNTANMSGVVGKSQQQQPLTQPLQALPHPVLQYYYNTIPHMPPSHTHTHHHTTTSPGLPFVDPSKGGGELGGMMGVVVPQQQQQQQAAPPPPPPPQPPAGNNGTISNTNNNYTTEGLMMQPRAGLMQGVGLRVGAPFKGQPQPQPQPAHTNLGVLHGKTLMSMPPGGENKPGSPVISILRSADAMQAPGLGVGGASSTPMDGVVGGGGGGGAGPPPPQRMPVFPYMPYMHHLPAGVHPCQPVFTYGQQPSRPVQTSTSVMTMSASHPVTVVTASHPPSSSSSPSPSAAAITTAIHRSPSHGNANGQQRDSSSNEALASGGGAGNGNGGGVGVVTDMSLSGVGMAVPSVPAAAGSPPVGVGVSQPCPGCAQQGVQQFAQSGHYPTTQIYSPYLPYYSNGLVPMAGGFLPAGPNNPSVSGMLTNGYTSDMYPYSNPVPAYPHPHPSQLNPSMYSMMGSSLYQGNPPSQPPMSNPRGSLPPHPQPLPVGGLSGATGGPSGTVGALPSMKQRNTGCYNCGSLNHKAAECNESSMETMSGKSVYSLDFKPTEESD